jgi:hypothetical protein
MKKITLISAIFSFFVFSIVLTGCVSPAAVAKRVELVVLAENENKVNADEQYRIRNEAILKDMRLEIEKLQGTLRFGHEKARGVVERHIAVERKYAVELAKLQRDVEADLDYSTALYRAQIENGTRFRAISNMADEENQIQKAAAKQIAQAAINVGLQIWKEYENRPIEVPKPTPKPAPTPEFEGRGEGEGGGEVIPVQ